VQNDRFQVVAADALFSAPIDFVEIGQVVFEQAKHVFAASWSFGLRVKPVGVFQYVFLNRRERQPPPIATTFLRAVLYIIMNRIDNILPQSVSNKLATKSNATQEAKLLLGQQTVLNHSRLSSN